MKNLLLACALIAGVSCSKGGDSNATPEPAKPIALTARQSEKLTADNTFAFRLFREVAASDASGAAGNNAFISPLSVTMALGMLYNGTSPAARDEMATALGVSGFSDTETNEYYQTMSRALLAVDPSTALSIANSIWCRKEYPVKQTFIDINKTCYDAQVETRNFALPSTVAAINGWCADKTRGRITQILDEIPSDAVMYLIDAVYFKSIWQSKFDKANTKNEQFTPEVGAPETVPMMDQTTTLPYYADDAVQCVEMPYGNGAFSMVAMLPAAGTTVDELINNLAAGAWSNIQASMRERNVHVKFPRFTKEYDCSLVDPVAALGMRLIFSPGGNLNGIADDPELCVSVIKHKTFVEVNEQGTEAAAVTIIGDVATAAGPDPREPEQFIANHPFVYLIRERSTGAILFIGRMDDPS